MMARRFFFYIFLNILNEMLFTIAVYRLMILGNYLSELCCYI